MSTANAISNLVLKSKDDVMPRLVFDNDTLDILHANSQIAVILGYSTEELSGLNLKEIIADDFSEQIDNENIIFPASKVVRQLVCKDGSTLQCLSENGDIDFDCSALIIYYAMLDVKQSEAVNYTSSILVDNVYASAAFNTDYSRN